MAALCAAALTGSPSLNHDATRRDPGQQVGYVLWQVQHQLQVGMESRLSAFRLSMPQFAALSLLALTTCSTAAELARQLMLSPQAGHTLLTRLQAAGHVQPVPGVEVKGRAIPMEITEQGRTILRRAAVEVDDVQETYLRALSATERTRLLEILKKCLPAERAAATPRTPSSAGVTAAASRLGRRPSG